MLQGIWDISSPTRDWTQAPTSPLLLPPRPLPQWDFIVLPTGPPGKSPGRRTQQEEERLQFFPGKNSSKEKNHGLILFFGLFVYYNPPSFFVSLKMFSFPCWVGVYHGLPLSQTLNYSSLLIAEKSVFPGKIFGCLFFQVNTVSKDPLSLCTENRLSGHMAESREICQRGDPATETQMRNSTSQTQVRAAACGGGGFLKIFWM